MQINEIHYEIIQGRKCSERLNSFLYDLDGEMIPSLSSRVNLSEYAEKLSVLAKNIFAVHENVDIAECSVYVNESVAFISSFAVRDRYRNSGVGSSLMDEVIELAFECGCLSIELMVHQGNENALLFYKKNKFIIKEHEGKWIKMERPLT